MRYLPWAAVGGLTFALLALPLLAQPPGPQPGPPPVPAKSPDAKPVAPPVALPEAKAAKLPLTRVALFTAGVGYFHREGEIDGTARLDLKVDEADVNDLILSLVTNDPKGRGHAVTYDNRAPAEITLKAFAVDLTDNPGVGALLSQVRGEAVEVTDAAGTVYTGEVVSVDKPAPTVVHPPAGATVGEEGRPVLPAVFPPPAGAVEQVAINTADGVRAVKVASVKTVKFVRPELQAEFRKALAALSAARGGASKTVGVTFAGAGPRKVSVGYLADAPLWKPTYRLEVADGGAVRLRCLAAVENTTDEDWENVAVKLVSGRPMTFKMDLYDPLFVPRPTIEPELYASLRPPMYQGAGQPLGNALGQPGGAAQFGLQGGAAQLGNGFGGGQNLGVGGGITGGGGFNGHMPSGIGRIGGGVGGITRPSVRSLLRTPPGVDSLPDDPARVKLDARPKSSDDLLDPAASKNLGEAFEYAVADPVSLPRFKSALLPVLDEAVTADRVSIFNPAMLPTHPLLGLRLKNATKLFLAQGPVTVYEKGTAVGQARLPDVKPGEFRLLSYAIDLDVDAKAADPVERRTQVSASVAAGVVKVRTRVRVESVYTATNKGTDARTLWVTRTRHATRKRIEPADAVETTPDLERLELKVPAKQTAVLKVVDEDDETAATDLATLAPDRLDELVKEAATPPAVKAALAKVRATILAKADAERGLAAEAAALKGIDAEQARLRANMERVPKESEAFKRYLKKFDDQETEIEKRRAASAELEKVRDKQAADLKEMATSLKAE